MSAIHRTVRGWCPRCRAPVLYRYDESGMSKAFDETSDGSAKPHACYADPGAERVGSRPLDSKTPRPQTK